MAEPVVGLLGMRELRNDLIRLGDDQMPQAFKEAGMAVAEPVAGRIRGALPYGPTGRLRGGVRVGKVRTGATIRVRSDRYAPVFEFGGYPRPAGTLWRQGAFRGYGGAIVERGGGYPFVREGRVIFPTAQGMAQPALDAYTREVQNIIDRMNWSHTATTAR